MKLLFLLLLCSSLAQGKELTVLAASSLTDALTKIGLEYEQSQKEKVKFLFDSSSRLAQQIEYGAKADLFFSADEEWKDHLAKKSMILASKNLLSNKLVLITHKDQKITASSLKDLPNMKFKNLVLAQETVPAGKYATEALKKEMVYDKIKSKIVTGDNVRNVLAWVARDEVDLGIVFATDPKVEPKVKVLYSIPAELHSSIIYPVALINKDAQKFYDYLQTDKAKKVFEDFGFEILK